MQQKKLNILLVRGGAENGVSYHRLFKPHELIKKQYDWIGVFECDAIEQVSNESLRKIDIVIANRNITSGSREQIEFEIKRVQYCGCEYVVDIDDYWILHHGHELAGWWKSNSMQSVIETNIRFADYITVTHKLLGNKTKKPYTVLPNGIDSTDVQFQVLPKVIRDRVSFGWVGSSNHYKDVSLLQNSLERLNKENADYTMSYCGFNKDIPHCSRYEKVLTGNYSQNDNYQNVEGQPVDKYALMYDQLDVALVPLVDNEFNNCKSNLKMLEAAFKKKAVIVSNVHPYNTLIKHGVNCLAVSPTDRHGWYKEMKKLIKNRELIVNLSEQLYLDVQEYELSNVNKERIKLYERIRDNRDTTKKLASA